MAGLDKRYTVPKSISLYLFHKWNGDEASCWLMTNLQNFERIALRALCTPLAGGGSGAAAGALGRRQGHHRHGALPVAGRSQLSVRVSIMDNTSHSSLIRQTSRRCHVDAWTDQLLRDAF